MKQRKECRYCGALADTGAGTCKLCGRSLEGARLVDSAIDSELFLNADEEVIDLTPQRAEVRPLGLDAAAWTTLAIGVAFALGYPWLLAAHVAQEPGTVQFDLTLALCWLAPEAYVVSGMVRAAQRANSARSAVPGLAFVGIAVAAQGAALFLARSFVPAEAWFAHIFGLAGEALFFRVPIVLYSVGSLVAAFSAAWLPRVVPGKFNRVIGPQLGCLSVLFAGLLLPSWGGLALMSAAAKWGVAPLWVDIAAAIVFPFFALFWFWPHD